jgi:hypothetical protein
MFRRGGAWKRGMVEIVGHSQTKERANGEPEHRPKPARQASTLLAKRAREAKCGTLHGEAAFSYLSRTGIGLAA